MNKIINKTNKEILLHQAKEILLNELREFEFYDQKGIFIERFQEIIDFENNLSKENFIRKVFNIINNTENPWLFEVIFDTAFHHLNKTTNISLYVDGELKVTGHKTWTRFLIDCIKEVGIKTIIKVEGLKEAIHLDEKSCRQQAEKCSIITDFPGYYINQQRLAGGSQHSGVNFERSLNTYFGEEKIKIEFIVEKISPEFKEIYKLK